MNQRIGMAAYSAVVALLAGVAAALGVFARGDGSFETVTSARGVTYDMATTGVYAFNSRQIVAEGVGWDVFTLAVAVPAMLVAAFFVARGSYRGRLVALGLFGYFFYQYLEYAMTWAVGPLFPLFITIYAGSLMGLVWLGVSVGRDGVAGRFSASFPRRAFAALNVTMSIFLALMWMARIAAALRGDLEGAGLSGETTLVVQALDLGLVLPLALLIAYVAWRRSEAGYALAAVYAVAAVAMSMAIAAMMISASVVHGELQLPPIVIFGTYSLLYAIVAVRIFRGIEAGAREAANASGRARPRAAQVDGQAHARLT